MTATTGQRRATTNDVTSLLLFATFVASVAGANWAIHRYGIVSIGFGLHAPAGVYFAGLALGLRDALHERTALVLVFAAIASGAAVSYWVADAVIVPGGHLSIAVASGIAFGLSEAADLIVYTPLRQRHWVAAVAASNIVGAAIDTLVFLPLAFGSSAGWADLVIGKLYLVPVGVAVVAVVRRLGR